MKIIFIFKLVGLVLTIAIGGCMIVAVYGGNIWKDLGGWDGLGATALSLVLLGAVSTCFVLVGKYDFSDHPIALPMAVAAGTLIAITCALSLTFVIESLVMISSRILKLFGIIAAMIVIIWFLRLSRATKTSG